MSEPSPPRLSPRPSLIDRLDSLLNSRTSLSSSHTTPQETPRSSLDSPTDHRRSSLAAASDAVPASSTHHSTPVLRWLSNWSPNHRRSPSATDSGSGSPSSSSPDLTLLREALQEPLITPPPMARLPPSFRPRNLTRPPPFLDNLTRSTLPTASLSPPLAVALSQDHACLTEPTHPPIVLNHSPPQHRSLDTLRRMSLPPSESMSSMSVSSAPESITPPSFLSGLPAASAFSWWSSESKLSPNNTDALLSEDDRNQRHKKKYKSTKNPVVFCHGLLGFDSVTIGPAIAPVQVTHWRGIKEVLEQNGTEVLITRVPATSSYVDRAKVLEERVSQVYPGRSVHLIGHSMGGLDCRYLTTHLTHRKFQVLSITTIATPHRGSSFADHFLKTVGKERMPSVMSLLDLLPNGGGDGKAFECLTVENMKKFNEETPDVEGVRYFSWGAVYEPGLLDTWKWPHSVILEKEGVNDGLVSIESSKWGTYLGTLSGVNHLDLVGWINTARYKWAEIMGKEIKFRPATFYSGIVDMLAREVEGQKDELDEQGEETQDSTSGINRETHTQEPELRAQAEAAGKAEREVGEREQMMHSLEDAGARVDSPPQDSPHLSPDLESATNKCKRKASNGSLTPKPGSLLGSATNSSGSVTPRAVNRVDEEQKSRTGTEKSS